MNKSKGPSKLWYLLPIFLGIIGGIVGYFAIRDKDRKMAKYILIVGFIPTILVIIFSAITFTLISAFPSQNITAQWQARIIITINEEQYPIPSDIGIVGNEIKGKVFTGNANGIIYKNVSENVTLKDFFDTWGKVFNNTCILDYCNTKTSSFKMYIWNGKWVENSDYESYVIKDKDNILIDYR
jgi:hypothetical protein